jgi:hypothetical protein
VEFLVDGRLKVISGVGEQWRRLVVAGPATEARHHDDGGSRELEKLHII